LKPARPPKTGAFSSALRGLSPKPHGLHAVDHTMHAGLSLRLRGLSPRHGLTVVPFAQRRVAVAPTWSVAVVSDSAVSQWSRQPRR